MRMDNKEDLLNFLELVLEVAEKVAEELASKYAKKLIEEREKRIDWLFDNGYPGLAFQLMSESFLV